MPRSRVVARAWSRSRRGPKGSGARWKRMKSRKSWHEKMNRPAKVVDIPPAMQKRMGSGKMLIPCPLDVDALIRTVRRGRLVTQSQIRETLARAHQADVACPITTGIFSWIAAHAAAEAEMAGAKRVTPYWRTLKTGGELNPKYPGGINNVRSRLVAEGHRVVKKGNRFFVVDFELALIEPKQP